MNNNIFAIKTSEHEEAQASHFQGICNPANRGNIQYHIQQVLKKIDYKYIKCCWCRKLWRNDGVFNNDPMFSYEIKNKIWKCLHWFKSRTIKQSNMRGHKRSNTYLREHFTTCTCVSLNINNEQELTLIAPIHFNAISCKNVFLGSLIHDCNINFPTNINNHFLSLSHSSSLTLTTLFSQVVVMEIKCCLPKTPGIPGSWFEIQQHFSAGTELVLPTV